MLQVVLLSHSDHDYFGDSDLENHDDETAEESQEPEGSKSEFKSDVSCLLLYEKSYIGSTI